MENTGFWDIFHTVETDDTPLHPPIQRKCYMNGFYGKKKGGKNFQLLWIQEIEPIDPDFRIFKKRTCWNRLSKLLHHIFFIICLAMHLSSKFFRQESHFAELFRKHLLLSKRIRRHRQDTPRQAAGLHLTNSIWKTLCKASLANRSPERREISFFLVVG